MTGLLTDRAWLWRVILEAARRWRESETTTERTAGRECICGTSEHAADGCRTLGRGTVRPGPGSRSDSSLPDNYYTGDYYTLQLLQTIIIVIIIIAPWTTTTQATTTLCNYDKLSSSLTSSSHPGQLLHRQLLHSATTTNYHHRYHHHRTPYNYYYTGNYYTLQLLHIVDQISLGRASDQIPLIAGDVLIYVHWSVRREANVQLEAVVSPRSELHVTRLHRQFNN